MKARFGGVIGAGQLVEDAPLAVQGQAPESGLFPFDKYSSAYLLFDAIREDIGRRWRNNIDAWRHLMLLPRAQVVSLKTSGNRVTEIELRVNDQQQFLRPPLLSPDCTVVLAASTIESTRLALDSLPAPAMGANRMGSNLMAHLRSDITARIRRTAIPGLPAQPTDSGDRRLARPRRHQRRARVPHAGHRQRRPRLRRQPFYCRARPGPAGRLRANQDPAWIPITLRVIGQMIGHPSAQPGDTKKSWVNLAWQNDPRTGRPRAWVNLEPSDADMTAWKEMEDAAVALAKAVAGNPADIQNIDDQPQRDRDDSPRGRDAVDGFPRPVGDRFVRQVPPPRKRLRGRSRAVPGHRLGKPVPHRDDTRRAERRTPSSPAEQPPPVQRSSHCSPDPVRAGKCPAAVIFSRSSARSWRRRPNGLGLLWYTREVFRNFVLKVDWLSFNPTTNVPGGRADNSGVLIRFPALNASDPANDWKLASDKGYEIQIDDMGFNAGHRSEFQSVTPDGGRLCSGAVLEDRVQTCWPVEYL